MTENTKIMETSLNGLSLFKAFDGFKDNLVPALVGAAGAGAALYGVNRLMSYPFGTFGSLDAKLAGVHAALPGVARLGIAVVGVPMVAVAAAKVSGGKLRVPTGALTGATAVLALFGVAAAVNAVRPGSIPLGGFAGAALLAENVGGPFGGASLGVEEAGKFGGIGGGSGPGFASVMGGYQ